jgi:hypothetical protein
MKSDLPMLLVSYVAGYKEIRPGKRVKNDRFCEKTEGGPVTDDSKLKDHQWAYQKHHTHRHTRASSYSYSNLDGCMITEGAVDNIPDGIRPPEAFFKLVNPFCRSEMTLIGIII